MIRNITPRFVASAAVEIKVRSILDFSFYTGQKTADPISIFVYQLNRLNSGGCHRKNTLRKCGGNGHHNQITLFVPYCVLTLVA